MSRQNMSKPKEKALDLAIKHTVNAMKALGNYSFAYDDKECNEESNNLLHQVNRLRNIKHGRRVYINDGTDGRLL